MYLESNVHAFSFTVTCNDAQAYRTKARPFAGVTRCVALCICCRESTRSELRGESASQQVVHGVARAERGGASRNRTSNDLRRFNLWSSVAQRGRAATAEADFTNRIDAPDANPREIEDKPDQKSHASDDDFSASYA